MITFPNAKINLGLNVLSKRSDGYHNIESLFCPLFLQDALEILPTSGAFEFTSSGLKLDCALENNIVVKAYRLLATDHHLPSVKIHLHKNIPFGAGLGGGSADAAFTLKMLNEMFDLQLSESQLVNYASQLGADCAFFIKNKPAIAGGIGDVLTPFDLNLSGWHLLVVKPDIHVSTLEAYRYVVPLIPVESLSVVLEKPVDMWRDSLKNDFEASVFKQYPALEMVKKQLYDAGAVYASMSGSGSSIYGLFKEKPEQSSIFASHFIFHIAL